MATRSVGYVRKSKRSADFFVVFDMEPFGEEVSRSTSRKVEETSVMLMPDWFARGPVEVARRLVGARLVVGDCEGVIVETEAYGDDSASHAVTRRRAAGKIMSTHGRVYTYKIHTRTCLNFTAGRDRPGAVLIRAVEPTAGLEKMAERRKKRLSHFRLDPEKTSSLKLLSSGPGRVCEAFGVTMQLNGDVIGRSIKVYAPKGEREVASTPRVGISTAKDLSWRFIDPKSPLLSRPFRAGRGFGDSRSR
jgi:DNA-3-methyladenine glycosylase